MKIANFVKEQKHEIELNFDLNYFRQGLYEKICKQAWDSTVLKICTGLGSLQSQYYKLLNYIYLIQTKIIPM